MKAETLKQSKKGIKTIKAMSYMKIDYQLLNIIYSIKHIKILHKKTKRRLKNDSVFVASVVIYTWYYRLF
jgi:hypothetical protein